MKTKVVLFDLDGTLLPMDQDVFVKAYFGGIAAKLAPHGYEPQKLIQAIWQGTVAMIKNDGAKRNEEIFWDSFVATFGAEARKDEPYFDAFYADGFDKVQVSCGYNAEAKETIALVKDLGRRVALATNPIFPAVATRQRIAWAGLNEADFELVTTYENSSYCKPNLRYYEEILKKLGVKGEDCLMVGNDVGEDMVAAKLGMKVFLLTDCLINRKEEDVSCYPHGGFAALKGYLKTLD